ncbi:MarR family transcriptional regulator with acetyltransferase activity [Aminivibrio pyruvatiphilus]|uniref:MarR family transcriptional regulator with acetyltransferase activity n=1 Tax=Aminivibrio pyruvatiphilus TaxID=1005740 RepID=A0A4R8M8R5_9BACT|nr:bifunctional helix-turn-helix transcriptional regulator/GNAT family N-acetyltransferase [Aminivibrio pyruvatiphilus]TDY60155.1 MarR family transcriptional regulator with acetyltransferase activity [Aminivibrio pyruvatiphilus]
MKDIPEQFTKQIRSFNRFYTGIIGAVNQSVLNSPFSLAEARVLYEIKHNNSPTASEINVQLGLDPGYLSRIIRRFEHDELLEKERSPLDGRAYILRLTPRGEHVLKALEKAAEQKTSDLLAPLPKVDVDTLLRSMENIRNILTSEPREVIIRPAKPGDLGIMASQHMDFYMKEYGLDSTFEYYLFEGMARFLKNREAGKGGAWVADHNGTVVGSIAIDHEDDGTAKLRWLLVHPEFRGMGLGRRLMDEVMEFCRLNLYRRIYLWTFSELREARHLYELYGFSPTEEVKHEIWGREITEERWDYLLFDPEEEEA